MTSNKAICWRIGRPLQAARPSPITDRFDCGRRLPADSVVLARTRLENVLAWYRAPCSTTADVQVGSVLCPSGQFLLRYLARRLTRRISYGCELDDDLPPPGSFGPSDSDLGCAACSHSARRRLLVVGRMPTVRGPCVFPLGSGSDHSLMVLCQFGCAMDHRSLPSEPRTGRGLECLSSESVVCSWLDSSP